MPETILRARLPLEHGSQGMRRWERVESALVANFHQPDIEAAKVLFSSVAAHRIAEHPPAWNMLIAPSGSMKTALLETLRDLPSLHCPDEFTQNTLISGKLDDRIPKQEATKKPKVSRGAMPASLLHRIGDEGILVIADFSTILGLDKNKLQTILSQLRRIYDGNFSREFGTSENLEDRSWQGRITLLAGVTPEFDKYHSVSAALGERFVRTRWPRAGGIEAALSAMRQKTDGALALRSVVHELLLPVLKVTTISAPRIEEADLIRIANLGELVVRARTPTKRDRVNRELEDMPDPEGNTRFPQQLAQIGRGWAALMESRVVTEDAMTLISRVAFDSIPPRRRDVLRALMDGKNAYSLDLASSVVERALEELEAVGLLNKPKGYSQASLSDLAISLLEGAQLCEPRAISPQFLLERGKEGISNTIL
jgi:hypothetical protein